MKINTLLMLCNQTVIIAGPPLSAGGYFTCPRLQSFMSETAAGAPQLTRASKRFFFPGSSISTSRIPQSAMDLSVVFLTFRSLKTASPESILTFSPQEVPSFSRDSTNSYAEHVYRALGPNPVSGCGCEPPPPTCSLLASAFARVPLAVQLRGSVGLPDQ